MMNDDEGWWRMMKDGGWMMNDVGIIALSCFGGFALGQIDRQID